MLVPHVALVLTRIGRGPNAWLGEEYLISSPAVGAKALTQRCASVSPKC